jgi:hypothetical protein
VRARARAPTRAHAAPHPLAALVTVLRAGESIVSRLRRRRQEAGGVRAPERRDASEACQLACPEEGQPRKPRCGARGSVDAWQHETHRQPRS